MKKTILICVLGLLVFLCSCATNTDVSSVPGLGATVDATQPDQHDATNKQFILKKSYNDGWDPSSTVGATDTTYDQLGQKIESITIWPDGGRSTAKYEYDTQGNLVRRIYNDADGSQRQFSYEYNNQNQMVREEWRLKNGNQPSWIYEYDANGNMVAKIDERSGQTQETYEYDGNGNQIRSACHFSDGTQSLTTYQYNEKGLLIESTWTTSGGYTVVDTISYEYDSYGNVLKKSMQSTNGGYSAESYEYW